MTNERRGGGGLNRKGGAGETSLTKASATR